MDTDCDKYLDCIDDNITMVENIIPHIYDYSYEAEPGTKWDINIKFTAQDYSGVSKIYVKVKGDSNWDYSYLNFLIPQQTQSYKTTLHISYDGSLSFGDGVDIYIEVLDSNSNVLTKEDHIDSIKQTAVNFFNKIKDWVKDKIGGWVLEKLEQLLKPPMKTFSSITVLNSVEGILTLSTYSAMMIIPLLFAVPFLLSQIINNDDFLNKEATVLSNTPNFKDLVDSWNAKVDMSFLILSLGISIATLIIDAIFLYANPSNPAAWWGLIIGNFFAGAGSWWAIYQHCK